MTSATFVPCSILSLTSGFHLPILCAQGQVCTCGSEARQIQRETLGNRFPAVHLRSVGEEIALWPDLSSLLPQIVWAMFPTFRTGQRVSRRVLAGCVQPA